VRLNDEVSAAHQPRLISADSAAFQPSLEMSDVAMISFDTLSPSMMT